MVTTLLATSLFPSVWLPKAQAFGYGATYNVTENRIVNAYGQSLNFHGVNRESLEWSCTGAPINNNQGGIPAGDFTTMSTKWGINSVRLPLNQDFWLSATGVTVATANNCPSYITMIKQAIANAEAAGLAVDLDLHWSDEGNLTNTNVGQKCMADQNSVSFWNSVATTFKSDRNVLFELYNEPHDLPWSIWRNGGTFTCSDNVKYQAVGMQTLANTVRATGAQNVILVGGNNWAGDLSGMRSVGAITGTNIAYAAHIYEPSTYSDALFDQEFGNTAQHAPVVMTEYGKIKCGSDSFDTHILDYMRSRGLSEISWAWWVVPCDWPSIISNADGTCANGGCAIQADYLRYAAGRQTESLQPYTTFPAKLVPSTNVHYSFEDASTNGFSYDSGSSWAYHGANASSSNSTTRAYDGTHSLAVSFPGGNTAGVLTKTGVDSLVAGTQISFHVYAPGGISLWVKPYFLDPNYQQTSSSQIQTTLKSGWNTVTTTVPSTFTSIKGLGLQIHTNGSSQVTAYVDSITWN